MLRDMKAHTHLKPGQKGTMRLLEKYGDALLCVRYRYDSVRGVRMKTVELIVEEKPGRSRLPYRNHDIVSVVVGYADKTLRDKLKAAGGRWSPEEKLWRVQYGKIRSDADLIGRILQGLRGRR